MSSSQPTRGALSNAKSSRRLHNTRRKRQIKSSSRSAGEDEQKTKERFAVQRACDACRTSKRRCSKNLPCDPCVRLGLDCTFNLPRRKRGRPRKSTAGNTGKRAASARAAPEVRKRPRAEPLHDEAPDLAKRQRLLQGTPMPQQFPSLTGMSLPQAVGTHAPPSLTPTTSPPLTPFMPLHMGLAPQPASISTEMVRRQYVEMFFRYLNVVARFMPSSASADIIQVIPVLLHDDAMVGTHVRLDTALMHHLVMACGARAFGDRGTMYEMLERAHKMTELLSTLDTPVRVLCHILYAMLTSFLDTGEAAPHVAMAAELLYNKLHTKSLVDVENNTFTFPCHLYNVIWMWQSLSNDHATLLPEFRRMMTLTLNIELQIGQVILSELPLKEDVPMILHMIAIKFLFGISPIPWHPVTPIQAIEMFDQLLEYAVPEKRSALIQSIRKRASSSNADVLAAFALIGVARTGSSGSHTPDNNHDCDHRHSPNANDGGNGSDHTTATATTTSTTTSSTSTSTTTTTSSTTTATSTTTSSATSSASGPQSEPTSFTKPPASPADLMALVSAPPVGRAPMHPSIEPMTVIHAVSMCKMALIAWDSGDMARCSGLTQLALSNLELCNPIILNLFVGHLGTGLTYLALCATSLGDTVSASRILSILYKCCTCSPLAMMCLSCLSKWLEKHQQRNAAMLSSMFSPTYQQQQQQLQQQFQQVLQPPQSPHPAHAPLAPQPLPGPQ